MAPSNGWRLLLVASGVLIIAGGMPHPRGETMAAMLANPAWLWSHALVLAGFVLLVAGLVVLRQDPARAARLGGWLTLAIWVNVAQMIELVFHTAAFVDAESMAAAGENASFVSSSTPVFSTHIALALVVYPIFGLVMVGFVVATARRRALGTPWIAPLGVFGALSYGLALPLVLVGVPGAGILFPMIMVFALWLVLAGIWPARETSAPLAG